MMYYEESLLSLLQRSLIGEENFMVPVRIAQHEDNGMKKPEYSAMATTHIKDFA